MTALLHRFCPDHTPSQALCGTVLDRGAGFTELDESALDAAPGDACVVCADLTNQACSDACLGARTEAAQ